MEFSIKRSAITIVLGLAVLNMASCADLAAINAQLAQGNARMNGTPQVAMAVQSEQSKPVQIISPKDKRVALAVDEAMPTINKVLAIHQCVQNWESQRQLNMYGVPGVNMASGGIFADSSYPDSQVFMKFHDRNKCVSITTLDQWTMPALNALQFRAVYLAEDSGETISFLYLFKKMDDGSWKLAQFNHA